MMERYHQEQVDRIDRLLVVMEANDPTALVSGVSFYDCVIFACQSMWHLKDWILNDPEFGAKDRDALKAEIHASMCLKICADIANGSKHLTLKAPKVGESGATLSDRTGFHWEPAKGIHREFFYVVTGDPTSPYHRMEVRDLLRACRRDWEGIINRHYLSIVDLG